MVLAALPRPTKGRRSPRLIATTALVVMLAGCSSVPDAVNPIEWYKGTRDFLIGEDQQQTAQAANPATSGQQQAAPGSNQPIPSLSSVPRRPQTSTSGQRAAISRGLVADREQSRRYSSEVLPRQGQAVDPLPSAVARRTAPPAAPVAKAKATPPAPRAAAPVAPPPPAQPVPQVVARPAPPPAAPAITPPPAPRVTPAPPQLAAAPPAPPRLTSRRASPPPPPRPAVAAPPRSQVARLAPQPRLGTIRAPRVTAFTPESGTIVVSSAGVQQLSNSGQLVSPIARPGAQPSRSASPRPALAPISGSSYQVATIPFGNGSARLSARDRKILRQVAQQARQVGGVIRIVGHASHRTKTFDPVKHKLTNLRVSSARADAVARELVKSGARQANMVVGAASDAEPRYLEHMPTGEAGNRRADVYIDF